MGAGGAAATSLPAELEVGGASAPLVPLPVVPVPGPGAAGAPLAWAEPVSVPLTVALASCWSPGAVPVARAGRVGRGARVARGRATRDRRGGEEDGEEGLGRGSARHWARSYVRR